MEGPKSLPFVTIAPAVAWSPQPHLFSDLHLWRCYERSRVIVTWSPVTVADSMTITPSKAWLQFLKNCPLTYAENKPCPPPIKNWKRVWRFRDTKTNNKKKTLKEHWGKRPNKIFELMLSRSVVHPLAGAPRTPSLLLKYIDSVLILHLQLCRCVRLIDWLAIKPKSNLPNRQTLSFAVRFH